MHAAGFMISGSGTSTTAVYDCGGRPFVIEKGKVTRYAER